MRAWGDGGVVCSGQVKAVLVKIGQHLAQSTAQTGGLVPAFLALVALFALLAPLAVLLIRHGVNAHGLVCVPAKGPFFPDVAFSHPGALPVR